ncbi:MAG TPA: class I adenylate-forming enzyme family protein [Acidimicrobiia bacterium]|nr:class I adenylate-forming enzyme family protein [Acidimicrobiia bacterium]
MPFPDFTPTFPGLLHHAARFGDHTYLVADDDRITYAELVTRTGELARGFLAAGIGKGSHVGILIPNSVDTAVVGFALLRIGAVVVPINTFLKTRELGWTIHHADLTELVTHPRFSTNDYVERLEAALPGLADQSADTRLLVRDAPFLRAIHVWGDTDRGWARGGEADVVARAARVGVDDAFLARAEECVVPADPALIVYSSGSTADPKGVLHSQGAVVRHSSNVLIGYPMGPDDVVFSSMPFFWIGGLVTALYEVMHVGATLVTQAAFDPGAALDLIEREGATNVTGWPQQGTTMSEHPSYTPARVATVVRTSMPDLVPPAQRPPEVNSTSLGMTEMCSVHTSWDQYDPLPESRRGTFGKSLPGIEHKVVDPVSGEEVAPGGDGELWVRGYSLMQGLHRREREEVFEPDGWYRTGDAGHFDADGWFYFSGRLGEMLKTPGGVNVTPAEVEAALMAFPDVLEAYVTGIPTDGGQLVVGAVVPRAGDILDGDELRARLKGELSAYKVPKHLWVCAKSELPFLESGKIKKQELAALLAARVAQSTA